MLNEIGFGENGFTSNFAGNTFDEFKEALPRLVEISKGINLSEGYVPQTIYWMFVDGRPVAYGKLRHNLNKKLLECKRQIPHTYYSMKHHEKMKAS
ncbi:hypothetical protein [Paenibacillus sp. HB172176]|uniref:hypothetical protein n=1 Tax=Paenibacillus sp. HB172176 TaxID=2493690 RepID=UPI00143AD60D|nr:hypothetical protein [Paenibacillus sp. HB172176]